MKKKKKIINYKEEIKFIIKSKRYILLSMLVFLVALIISITLKTPAQIETAITEMLRHIAQRFENAVLFQTISSIFLNNSLATLASIIFGILFGIVPIFSAVLNGYIIGFVAKKTVAAGLGSNLLKVLPYGIFELSAVFISLGIGIKIGFEIFSKRNFSENISNAIKTYFKIVLPLLLVAAIIEGALIFYLKS